MNRPLTSSLDVGLVLVLLVLGMPAHGGDQMPGAAPFRTQRVEVALGTSGETVALTTTESGAFTLRGKPFQSGDAVASGNGNQYRLELAAGSWTARFNTRQIVVQLGILDETVIITQSEDGGYRIGDTPVESGETIVTAANGNRYMLTIGEDGMWQAVYEAMTGTVTVGGQGLTISAVRTESGNWAVENPLSGETETLNEGSIFMLGANTYRLASDGAGKWVAIYEEVLVDVMLGLSGETVVLTRAEDGSFWLDELQVEAGVTMVEAAGGNRYALTVVDGAWTAEYLPKTTEVQGTGGLIATVREDGTGYDVAGTRLLASGTRDIEMETAGSYRVVIRDGALLGTRLDPVTIDADTDFKTIGVSAMPTILADDKGTKDIDEANTALVVAGESYLFGDLLGAGLARAVGKNFVADARQKLIAIRAKIVLVLDLFDADRDRDVQVDRLWGQSGSGFARTHVKGVLQSIFGPGKFADIQGPDDNVALGEIDELIKALSGVDELALALAENGHQLKGAAAVGDAAKIIAATSTESTVAYGRFGNTRFGTIVRQVRQDAVSDSLYDFSPKMGERGAFAFGVTGETERTRHVRTTGTAVYEGATLAVSGAGERYAGEIEISVNFVREMVDGLIKNLATADGEPWTYLFGEVDRIVLPSTRLNSHGRWQRSATNGASVVFPRRAGAPRPQLVDGTFGGRLLGGNTAPGAGSEVVGVWSLGADTESPNYLAGGFGAERVSDEPLQRAVGDEGTGVAAVLVDTGGVTTLSSGKLTLKPMRMQWYREPGGYLNFRQGHATGRPQSDSSGVLHEELSLAALLASEGGEFSRDSPQTHVQVALEEVQLQRDRIAALLDLENGQDDINRAWGSAQVNLLGHVFFDYGSRENGIHFHPESARSAVRLAGSWEDQLPAKVNGGDWTPAPSDVLVRLDAIIAALSSRDGFEAAFDPAANGIFVIQEKGRAMSFLDAHIGDGDRQAEAKEIFRDASNTRPVALFNQGEWQFKAKVGTTDYTRFGVWRVRWARNALRTGGWLDNEMESFAYSPLPLATAAHASALPDGGQAAYEGRTVAYVGTVGYEGEAHVGVRWFEDDRSRHDSDRAKIQASEIGGHVTTVIRNLRHATTGADLYHDGRAVRQLVFATTAFSTGASRGTAGKEADHDLAFSSRDVPDWASTKAEYYGELRFVEVDYRDESVARPSARPELREYEFAFVGATPHGPLGVVGRYDFAGDAVKNKFGTKAREMNMPLIGAFGADLP